MKAGDFNKAAGLIDTVTSIELKDNNNVYAIHFLAMHTPKADEHEAYKNILRKYLSSAPSHFQTAQDSEGNTPFAIAFLGDNKFFIKSLIELLNEMDAPALEPIRAEIREVAASLAVNNTPLNSNVRNAFGTLKGGRRTRRR